MDDELVAKITRAVRVADEQFEESGGSSRHWVRECFLPCLEAEGLEIHAKEPS
jgi:hypothetical protein